MPSPVGHILGGIAAGWIVAGAPPRADRGRATGSRLPIGRWAAEAALFGALGALPDVDLLVGAHSGPTHSLGAAAIAGLVAGWIAVRRGWLSPPVRVAIAAAACAAAYGSHVLLDWLSRDTTAPIGIMALWPFRREYYESDLHLFMAISRRYYQGWTFVQQNGLAVIRELVILIPVLILVVVLRPRTAWSRAKR